MARTKTATGRKHETAGAVARDKVSPAVRFTDMKANVEQKFSIVGAKMSEKMTYLCANFMLKFYRLQHPSHPVKRVAAAESIMNMKTAAVGVFSAVDTLSSRLYLDALCVSYRRRVVDGGKHRTKGSV